MVTWMTIWVLTVMHNEHYTSSSGGGGQGYAYQLTYKDQKSCNEAAMLHRQFSKRSTSWRVPDKVYNEHKSARCGKQDILVSK